MADQLARDQASAAALATAAVLAHLMREFVGKSIISEQRVFDLLHAAELDLLGQHTIPTAMAAGHVNHIRDVFQKLP